jgi:hypothetical protein
VRTAALAAAPVRQRISYALNHARGTAHGIGERCRVRQRRALPGETQKHYPDGQPPVHFNSIPRRTHRNFIRSRASGLPSAAPGVGSRDSRRACSRRMCNGSRTPERSRQESGAHGQDRRPVAEIPTSHAYRLCARILRTSSSGNGPSC